MVGPRGRTLDRVGDEHGPWTPLAPVEVAVLLHGAPFRWWITGGHALELHLHRSWRVHADVDVGICREDAPALHDDLTAAGLVPWIAAGGQLRPWDGRPLSADEHENNVWWRRTAEGPWVLDTAIGDGTAEEWVYRRDPSIRRPWAEAVLTTPHDVPYLAPELQLLFKSEVRNLRPKDDLDAEEVVPRLSPARRAALAGLLPADHPWQAITAR
jgi:hypothetical protein